MADVVRSGWGAMPKLLRCVALLGLGLLVASCRADLYSSLTEVEANQMLAVLMASGIPAEKANRGKGGMTLSVDERDVLRALSILNDRGYPKNTRDSVGKVFQKSGIMSSPFEERVRYIYALGEDVAQTLSQVDGVVTARVHIVLPDAPQLGQPIKPSSAAVFIKHQPGVDLDFFVPQIRRLVSSSIEGLQYTAVTVVLSEAAPMKMTTTAANPTVEVLPGLAVRDTDVGRFWEIVAGTAAFMALLMAASAAGLIAYMRSRRHRRAAEVGTGVAVLEPT